MREGRGGKGGERRGVGGERRGGGREEGRRERERRGGGREKGGGGRDFKIGWGGRKGVEGEISETPVEHHHHTVQCPEIIFNLC